MARVKKNLSIEPETAKRLEQYAQDHHMNVSQAVTAWIWSESVSTDKQGAFHSIPRLN